MRITPASSARSTIDRRRSPGRNLGLPRESGDIAKDAMVPSSYLSYRLNERSVFALSVNSPFGLSPSRRTGLGRPDLRAHIRDQDLQFRSDPGLPVIPTLAVGVGLQVEHIEGRLKRRRADATTRSIHDRRATTRRSASRPA